MNQIDIAWLAGLLEGEGCFGNRGNCTTIQLQMTDEDIVRKSGDLVGVKTIGYRRKDKPQHKPMFHWTICGDGAAKWMETVLPFMGSRRSAKIRSLLKLRENVQRQTQSTLVCSHVAQYRRGRTVCDSCYKKDWYQRNKGGDAL